MTLRGFAWLVAGLCLLGGAPSLPAERWLVRESSSVKALVLPDTGQFQVVRTYHHLPWQVVEANADGADALKAACKNGSLLAEPDQPVIPAALPNDPYLTSQTYMQAPLPDADIRLADAWNLKTAATNVVVAVVDSGVDTTHPDLAANLWRNSAEAYGLPGVDDDNNGYIDDINGWNVVSNDGNVTDTLFHGTHVTGVLAAVGNNGLGITGVCWQARVMIVRCFDQTHSSIADALAGLDYIFDFPQVRVINASWGVTDYSTALQETIALAQQHGMLIVAAAGNNGRNIDTEPFYPASLQVDNVISVAGIDQSGALWDSYGPAGASNFGEHVTVAAPAANVVSTRPGGNYLSDSGTSYAAPHVVGAIALLLSREPALTPADVKARLIATARRTASLAAVPLASGLLDVRSLLQPPSAATAWWCY
jgi:subtilisin family serine protease